MGLFIAFEGLDGSGKSTQLARLARRLRAAGESTVETREPNDSLGIRQLLLHSSQQLSPTTEAILFAADRSHHLDSLINPALDSGSWVLTDRYLASSLAYQDFALSSHFNYFFPRPDLTILLDIPPETALERLSGDKDKIESRGLAYFQQVASRFTDQAIADTDSWLTVDATKEPDEIEEEIWSKIAIRRAG